MKEALRYRDDTTKLKGPLQEALDKALASGNVPTAEDLSNWSEETDRLMVNAGFENDFQSQTQDGRRESAPFNHESSAEYLTNILEQAQKEYRELGEFINSYSQAEMHGLGNQVTRIHQLFNKISREVRSTMDLLRSGADVSAEEQSIERLFFEFQSHKEELMNNLLMRTNDTMPTSGPDTDLTPPAEQKAEPEKSSDANQSSPDLVSPDSRIEAEVEKDLQFYQAWQNGNVDNVFARRSKVTGWDLKKIRQDINLSLRAAGYSKSEIDDFFASTIDPWSAEAASTRKEMRKTGGEGVDHTKLKTDILNVVKGMLAGREPNPEVFRARYREKENQDQLYDDEFEQFNGLPDYAPLEDYVPPAPVEALPEQVGVFGGESETMQNQPFSPEAVNRSEAAVDKQDGGDVESQTRFESGELKDMVDKVAVAKEKWNQFAATLPPYRFTFEQERINIFFQTMDAILQNSDYDETKKVTKLAAQLEHLVAMQARIREALQETVSPTDTVIDEERRDDPSDVATGTPSQPDGMGPSYLDLVQADPLLQNKQASVAKGDPNNPDTWQLEPMEGAVDQVKDGVSPEREMSAQEMRDEIALGNLPVLNEDIASPEAVPEQAATTPEVAAAKVRLEAAGIDPNSPTIEKQRNPLLETKREMRRLQSEYQAGLKQYYRERGGWRKTKDGVRKLFGAGDYLPPELLQMQQATDRAAEEYKRLLNNRLELRSLRSIGSTLYAPGSDRMNQAYENVLVKGASVSENLGVEEGKLDQARAFQEAWPRVARIQEFMKNNPKARAAMSTAMKGVGLGVAASLGFATAGLSGVGFGVGRWALSTTAGITAARYVARHRQQFVEAAENRALELMSGPVTAEAAQASVAERRRLFRQATVNIESQRLRQKAWATAAAFAAGGSTNLMAGAVVNGFTPDSASSGAETTIPNPEPVYNDDVMRSGDPYYDALQNNPTESIATNTEQQAFIPELQIDHFDGTGRATVLSGVDVRGPAGADTAIIELHRPELEQTIKLLAGDILAESPHISEAKLQSAILTGLENKYGGTTWWQDTPVTEVNIGEVRLVDPENVRLGEGVADAAPVESVVNDDVMESGADLMNNNLVDEAAERLERLANYEVKSGDNLWKIMQAQYGDLLSDLTPAERNIALDKLFDEVRSNVELRDSLGLDTRADGSIDKLWPGNKLDLTQIGERLEAIVADKESLLPSSKPATGALAVEGGGGVEQVPIKFGQTPVDPTEFGQVAETYVAPERYSTAEQALPVHQDPLYNNPVSNGAAMKGFSDVQYEVPEVPVPPDVTPVDGNYLNTAEYQNYIKTFFPKTELFNQLVDQSVAQLEGETYDALNRWLQEFKSPFKATPEDILNGDNKFELARMSVADIDAWRKSFSTPDAMKNFALENGFKYETLRAWLDQYDMLKNPASGLPYTEKTTFGDLFGRAVAKSNIEARFNEAYMTAQR